jgi:hypothetical protein
VYLKPDDNLKISGNFGIHRHFFQSPLMNLYSCFYLFWLI